MFRNTWNIVIEWFKDRSERSRLVRNFNQASRDAFVSGVAPTLLKSSLSRVRTLVVKGRDDFYRQRYSGRYGISAPAGGTRLGYAGGAR